jgi:hypothetical protein
VGGTSADVSAAWNCASLAAGNRLRDRRVLADELALGIDADADADLTDIREPGAVSQPGYERYRARSSWPMPHPSTISNGDGATSTRSP